MNVELEVISGPGAGRSFRFNRHDVFLVGRSLRCHFCVGADELASRLHLLIEVSPARCMVRDMGSTDGTWLNDQRVEQADLQDGDRIRAGDSILLVCAPGLRRSEAVAQQQGEKLSGSLPVFPGYRILSEMKPGGMAMLWKAEDCTDGRPVVIKTVKSDLAITEHLRKMFVREIKLSLQMAHPNIVRFLNADEHEGMLYIVMEFVPGMDAERLLLHRAAPLPAPHVVEIGRQTLQGLAYAHALSVVHRDIKPSNIMVTGSEPDDYDIRLTDFGLARKFREHGFSSLTQPGDIRGTVAFMPPEQVLDCKHVDHRADLFSLAATLYYLLTRQPVFPFRAGQNELKTILDEEIVPIERRGVAVPPQLARIIHRGLQKERDRRYPSAQEMKAALDSIRN